MKILNKRPILAFSVMMVALILILLYHNSFALSISLIALASVLFPTALFIFLICKNDTVRYIFSRLCIFALTIILSIGTIFVNEKLYQRDYCTYSGYATVNARVVEVGDMYAGNKRSVVLDDARVTTSDFSKDLYGKVKLVIICDNLDESVFEIGKVWVTNAKISFSQLYYRGEYGLSFLYAVENITCSGYAMQSQIDIYQEDLDLELKDIVKRKVTSIVEENLDEEFSGLALGMLFGDKTLMNEEIKQDFSATGIAHILAVSGLHVGFLFSILSFICKIFKIRGFPRFITISILLIFYAYLCGFSVSVVRATIMCICMLFAGCRFKRYDSLNSWACALAFSCIFMPFDVTTLGFKLSYMAVLSIILLARPLTKLLSHIFKDKMANTIATMLAVQIGTCGILISAFNNITILAIVANFISIPIASFAYMILFITVALSVVFPFAGIFVYLFQFVSQIMVKFVHLIAPVSQLPLSSWKGMCITYTSIGAMYASSNYLFINKTVKLIINIVLWVAIGILLLV